MQDSLLYCPVLSGNGDVCHQSLFSQQGLQISHPGLLRRSECCFMSTCIRGLFIMLDLGFPRVFSKTCLRLLERSGELEFKIVVVDVIVGVVTPSLATECWPPNAGHQMLATECWPPNAGHRMLATECWPPNAGHRMLATECWPPNAGHRMLATECWPPNAGHRMLATECWPPNAGHRMLATECWPPNAGHRMLGSSVSLLVTTAATTLTCRSTTEYTKMVLSSQ